MKYKKRNYRGKESKNESQDECIENQLVRESDNRKIAEFLSYDSLKRV